MADYALSDITPEDVAKADVSPEFFGTMLRKLADHHGDGDGPSDPYLAAFFSYVEFAGLEPGENEDRPNIQVQDHLRISSAVNRFFAMGELEKAGHLNHWTKDKEDHVMLHPALIEAACACRLLVKGEEFYFQPMEFLNAALNAAETNQPF